MKQILSGNEAIARGAYEASVAVAAAYPGTPSTEILENIARHYPEIYSEWSTNEKVAFEVAMGGSFAGARALAAMKHVGLNVAMDPLMTAAYTGIKGGFVLVVCDDPEMHSSQNEQDNRNIAKFALIPLIEPSDSQEAKDFLKIAYNVSEEFDTPVILRLTTRISHSKGVVELGSREEMGVEGFTKNPEKYVMIPAYAKKRHPIVLERYEKLKKYSEKSSLNKVEKGTIPVGVITSGIAYQYVKEVLPHANIFKIGFSFPLPLGKIKKFASTVVDKLYVVEELEPFIEEQLKAYGIDVYGKKFFSRTGELTPEIVEDGFRKAGVIKKKGEKPSVSYNPDEIIPRPPVLCPGCPHRGVFYALKKLKANVFGDIGCYTLGTLPPLQSLDTCICMGASITTAMGVEKAAGSSKGVCAVIGDSTFFHSGIAGLIDASYNGGTFTVIILDNRTTAMTGGQEHPGTGKTIKKNKTKKIEIADICKAIGIDVYEVDPYNSKETFEVLKRELGSGSLSVVMTKMPCVVNEKPKDIYPYRVVIDKCTGCKACIMIGCPAISFHLKSDNRGKAEINPLACIGCDLCAQVCHPKAIIQEGC